MFGEGQFSPSFSSSTATKSILYQDEPIIFSLPTEGYIQESFADILGIKRVLVLEFKPLKWRKSQISEKPWVKEQCSLYKRCFSQMEPLKRLI
jgi:hypothetical protein